MDLHESADHLAQLIEEKMGVRGDGLAAKLNRAGRTLPKHIRADAMVLVNALMLEGHPKLSRQIDLAVIERAYLNAERYLSGVDAGARRWGLVLDWLAKLAFNLIMLAVLLVVILRWQGLL